MKYGNIPSYKETRKVAAEYKLKPWVFPEGFILTQDTRECLPLFTRIPKGLTICSAKLDTGDYSVFGMHDKFCVERKMVSDLISFCTTEREKTKLKLARMSKMDWSALVVEARESDLYQSYLNSKVSPEVIRQSLVSFSVRWKIHVYIGNRENCCRYILDHAIKFFRVAKEL
jgi:ERCC4-type nuclease